MKLPTQPPVITGPRGRAWRFDLQAMHARQPHPAAELQLCAWAVHAPASHPIWPCVIVTCISLRDLPGIPPAKINLPGATHEVVVMALNPDVPLQLDKSPALMQPSNYVGQFIAASDDEARERVDAAVREICAGTLNPDSDGRHQWAQRFGRSNFKAAADTPDFVGFTPAGGVIAVGTGAANVKKLVNIAEIQATLGADERNPQ